MNEVEAYARLAEIAGVDPELMPYIADLTMEQTVINPILPETVKQLGRILNLRPGQTILDLACGKGGASLPLVHIYKVKLTGVDIMPDYIRDAWSRAEHTGLYELCRFELADAAEFVDRTSNQWDAVLVLGALPFIWPDLNEGLKKAAGLVKSGGKLVIGMPYLKPGGEQDPEAPQKSKEDMTAFLAQAGEVVETLDDGDAGWDLMISQQGVGAEWIKRNYAHKPGVMEFINGWVERSTWEKKNWGYALWVIQVP